MRLKREHVVVLSAVGIGFCAALGVGLASQMLLDEPLDTVVDNGVRAGLLMALLFLGIEYIRQDVL